MPDSRFQIPNLKSAALLLLVALLLSTSSGCSLAGIAAYKLSGTEKHPPAFALPPEPTIVIVDRPVNFDMVSLDAQRIGSSVTERLKASKAVTATMLDPGLAIDRRSRPTADGSRRKPTQLAAECGATQMIYIELTQYESSPSVGGDAAEGHIEASVWVVDVTSGQVKWPAEANQGYPVTEKIPFTPIAGHVSEDSLRAKMDDAIADKAARVFTGYAEE